MAFVTAYILEIPGDFGSYLLGTDLKDLYVGGELLPHGLLFEATSSLYTIVSYSKDGFPGGYNEALNKFTGSDFTYDASHKLIGGVVTGWEQWGGGNVEQKLFSVAGLAVPATTFAGWLDNGAVFTAPILLGGDDSLTGTSESETIWGYVGNDTIDGGGSPSDVVAAYSSDYLRGGDGADVILGGVGADDINGNQGNDTVHGGAGDDWAVGGKDEDVVYGDGGGDIVCGNLGNDTCDGGAGSDLVRGGQGDDSLAGGAGDDWLSGDRGSDTLSGGAGADIFHSFGEAGVDRVTDFNFGEGDRVQLDPGSAYTGAQVGADTVITLGGGAQMILVGVQLSTLSQGWIFEG